MVFFSDNEQNTVTLPHRIQRKHVFLVKMRKNSKSQKYIPQKKVSLESLHQRLGQRSTRSLLDEDTVNVSKYIELRVDTEPFCTPCQISTINEKDISNTPLKWVFIYIISATSSKISTKDTTFYNYLLIMDAYSKIPKLYGMDNITTEEVMENYICFRKYLEK